MTTALARCLHRGCPLRFRDGPDRLCGEHADDVGIWPDRLAEWSEAMTAPGDRQADDDGAESAP